MPYMEVGGGTMNNVVNYIRFYNGECNIPAPAAGPAILNQYFLNSILLHFISGQQKNNLALDIPGLARSSS